MSKKREIEINDSELEESSEQQQQPGPELQAEVSSAMAPGETGGSKEETGAGGETPALSEIEQLRQRVAELEDSRLRIRADFDNFRKRTARQLESAEDAARDQVFLDLLAVVDSFERGLTHANDETSSSAVVEGMNLIYGQLMQLMQRYAVVPIVAVGQPFDPHLHDAVMRVASAEYPEGTVAVEITRGYRIGDRVLRFSRVGVSSGATPNSYHEKS